MSHRAEKIPRLKKIHVLLCSTLIALMAGSLALAGDLEDATAADSKGDYGKAFRLLQAHANRGDRVAQYKLGMMFFDGQGVKQDYPQAAAWIRKASDQGLAYAQGTLGTFYVNGQGVSKDLVLAYMWLSLAASRLPDSEAETRAKTIQLRETIAIFMTPDEIAKAQKLTREWKAKEK